MSSHMRTLDRWAVPIPFGKIALVRSPTMPKVEPRTNAGLVEEKFEHTQALRIVINGL